MKKNVVKAYRIEYKDGYGPFRSQIGGVIRSRYAMKDFRDMIYSHISFPSIHEERTDLGLNWFCAYKSENQLLEYCRGSLEKMIKCNFEIYELEVKDGIVTNYQILFKKKNVIEKKKITNRIFKKYKKLNKVFVT